MRVPRLVKNLLIADLSPAASHFSLGTWQPGEGPPNQQASTAANKNTGSGPQPEPLSKNLTANTTWLKDHFNVPVNAGILFRPLRVGAPPVDAMLIYVDDQVDWEHLNRTLLEPLLALVPPAEDVQNPLTLVRQYLPEGNARTAGDRQQVARNVMAGYAALLIDGADQALLAEVRGWAKRAIDKPSSEMGVRGPQEGFTEDIRSNVSMVRRYLRTPNLVVEWMQIGRLSRTDVVLLYVKTVANQRLVDEARRRLNAIDVDAVIGSGAIEQWLEDHPYAIFPSVVTTERPDRVTGQLTEGYVSVLVANTPYALIVPGNITLFLQSPEDAHIRWQYATFARIVRSVAFFIALLLPGIYVAIASFHQEMIPTPLMLAISATRETVPLPLFLEVVLMESMFELIREAGLRIPTAMGQTIGIVGALILGQAAVQAGVISPILVILTAATALSSFCIPNYSLQYSVRILRFGFIVAGTLLGLFGITLLFLVILLQHTGNNSFGVPVLTPFSPYRSWADAVVRVPPWVNPNRPGTVRPADRKNQSDQARPWTPDGS